MEYSLFFCRTLFLLCMLDTILALDFEGIIAAIMTIVAAVAGIIAGFKNSEAKKQKKNTEQAEKEKQEVIDFFDAENTEVQTPPASVPARSWKMSDSVKTFLLAGHSEKEQVEILKQVEEAEAKQLVEYTIHYEGGYYVILYGQINRHAAWGK